VTDLAARWPLASHEEVRDHLLAAYDEETRSYHDLRHLTEVLNHLELLGCADVTVLLAAWFHDAVYDARPAAESRSAQWAERALPDPPAGEVARLVLITEHHRPAPGDERGATLCDADLAILAAEPARYSEYLRGVREEYGHLSDAAFRAGRVAVLHDLVDRPALFLTECGRDLWEARARSNIVTELAHLS
jgi:predicted metal-dependent HD superfamily phosphohydrolase